MAYDEDEQGPDEVEVHRGDQDYILHLPEGEHAQNDDLDSLSPEEKEHEELFGPGGKYHGLDPVSNPGKWQEEFGERPEEEQERLRWVALRAGKQRQEKEKVVQKKAAEAAFSAERMRRGILESNLNEEAHPRHRVQLTGLFKVPENPRYRVLTRGDTEEGSVHAQDIDRIEQELGKLKIDLYGPMTSTEHKAPIGTSGQGESLMQESTRLHAMLDKYNKDGSLKIPLTAEGGLSVSQDQAQRQKLRVQEGHERVEAARAGVTVTKYRKQQLKALERKVADSDNRIHSYQRKIEAREQALTHYKGQITGATFEEDQRELRSHIERKKAIEQAVQRLEAKPSTPSTRASLAKLKRSLPIQEKGIEARRKRIMEGKLARRATRDIKPALTPEEEQRKHHLENIQLGDRARIAKSRRDIINREKQPGESKDDVIKRLKIPGYQSRPLTSVEKKELSALHTKEQKAAEAKTAAPSAAIRANPEVRDRQIKRYESLRQKFVKDNLTPEETKEFNDLYDMMQHYDPTFMPQGPAKSPEDVDKDHLQDKLKERYKIRTPEEVLRSPEDIESTVSEYGQEDPHLGLIKGWQSTTRFNQEQYKRKANALARGTSAFGWNAKGEPVAPEKARVSFGPNKELHVLTNQWLPNNPRAGQQGQDSFTVKVPHTQKKQDWDEEGNYYVEGQNFSKTINDLGMGLKWAQNDDGTVTVHTEEGQHLNPDQIDKLKEELFLNHGIKDVGSKGTIRYTRRETDIPVGYDQNKLPKELDIKEIVPGTDERNIYKAHLGYKLGQRDPITGDLLKGERNSLGLQGANRSLQLHLDDSTDAVGWGTSWRPGSKEMSNVVFALPKAREERLKAQATAEQSDDFNAAWQASMHGDDSTMSSYFTKYYPDDTAEQLKERQNPARVKEEGSAVASAAAAAGYYTFKHRAFPRTVNRAYFAARRAPVIGKPVQRAGRWWGTYDAKEGGGIIKDAQWIRRRTLPNIIDRAKFRVGHPLTSGMRDPISGEIVPDPTSPGIMFHHPTKPGDPTGLEPVLPNWRYRKHINMPPERRQARLLEKDLSRFKSMMSSRVGVDKVLSNPEASGLQRRGALLKAKTMLHDSFRGSTDEWVRQLRHFKDDVYANFKPVLDEKGNVTHYIINKERQVDIGGMTTIKNTPEYEKALLNTKTEIDRLMKAVEDDPGHFSYDALKDTVTQYYASHPREIPKAVKTFGKASIGGAALAGAGLLAVDKYQTYQHNKGHEVNHPILKAVVPERIAVPTAKVRRTSSYTIPDNVVTNALDFQGMKVPTAGRLSFGRKEVVRLREHKDISGEPYNSNLPIMGGLKLTKPVKTEGSAMKGLVQSSTKPEISGPTKNIYIKGKKVPIDLTMGKKERWSDKNHQLKAKYNPYKIDMDDRQKLIALAQASPEAREQISSLYQGDQKLQEMLDSKKDVDAALAKNAYWLMGTSKGKANISRHDSSAMALQSVSMRGENKTLEEVGRQSTQESRDKRTRKAELAEAKRDS